MRVRSAAAAALAAAALLLGAALARAAGPPQIEAAWVTEVTATSALLHAQIDPDGATTTYHFSYIAQAAYEANLAAGREGFAGAARAPAGADQGIGAGSSAETAFQPLGGLAPETAYRYRVIAQNTAGPAQGPEQTLTTRGTGGPLVLLDDRGWEMVSPVEKNGGAIAAPESLFGGGVLQAAADGEAVTYSSSSSFGEGAQGAPQASQYISRRASGGWSTQNITAPTVPGAYGDEPDGVPYQLFSPDLSSGLLLNAEHCQGSGSGCPLDNPPLPGTEAPAGYQDYYLRDDEDGGLQALLSEANSGELSLGAAQFGLAFAGAAPDLRHVVLSSCAKLTPEATEVPGAEGCEAPETNLYEWGEGQLRLINILPHAAQGTPGAQLAAQSLAVSTDGSRVYFTDAGKLYLREGGETRLLAAAATFQTASADGSVAFFTEGAPEHETLYRYQAATETSEPLATEVKGVLGASEDGAYLYYATAAGLFLWNEGTITTVSATPGAAAESDWPPTTGTARVSADGTRLAFLSKASLTGYDNTDQSIAQPDSEVYLYSAPSGGGEGTLLCASCNPTGERPLGPSSIPGAIANGQGEGATHSYKPRDLAAGGRRLFFDSPDPLVSQDTNKAQDVYEWEAGGTGSCQRAGGCVELISSGNSAGGASFLDASADGADVFFLTEGSLVPSDPGSVDLYDAREGGGFPLVAPPIACEGDACQPLPSPPEDPTPGSLVPSSGNPPVHFPKAHQAHRRKPHHHRKRRHHRKSRRRR